MIKSLHITNFQSHGETSMEFHNGVNVIVGSSDSGKSAIIRAIRWLSRNRPSGNDIRSWWGGQTSVNIEFEEESILRIKDKTDFYKHKNGKRKLNFKAFGTSVPEEISLALNLNEINIQHQLDRPFLLDSTPGAVALHFNKVAKLDKIDLSIQNINSWIRELTSDIKYKEIQITEIQSELKKYDKLEKLEIELEVLESMTDKSSSLKNRIRRLMDLNASYYDNRIHIDYLSQILIFEEPINQIIDWQDKVSVTSQKALKLKTLLQNIIDVGINIDENEKITNLEDQVTSIIKLYTDSGKLEKRILQLSAKISTLNNIQTQLNKVQLKEASLIKEFNRVFPNVCPLCGTKLK